MGMDVGSSTGAMSSPNVVPLIDILLVLIIIFMVITPLTPKGLDTLVPQPSPNQQQNQELENKTVYVKSDARAKYGDVVAVVDEIRSAGVDQLGLLTEKTQAAGAAKPNPQQPANPGD